MVDQKTKQDIVEVIRAISHQNDELWTEAVIRLRDLGISDLQIFEQLQAVLADDPSSEVRMAAQKCLDAMQETQGEKLSVISNSPGEQAHPSISKNEEKILELLQKQNDLLENIQTLLMNQKNKDEKAPHIYSHVVDLDMPLSSVMEMCFKWFIASIPVGIIAIFFFIIVRLILDWMIKL